MADDTTSTSIFSVRDLQRLAGVHPELIARIERVFLTMAARNYPMFVVQGVRTAAEQHELWLQGRDAVHPGPIVTMKDGYVHKSNHQVWADNCGHAVDCAFLPPPIDQHDPRVPFNPFAATLPWESYGLEVEKEGLIWGGRWTHPHDSPHAELGIQA